ncbi:uncharacterized protein K489DRAFT_413701 [Dissoconium aciculare CBS 342.82]|uniref:Uncharacterized protein n=1 Tax=Dissoconium aciculare CBS 342.82 TaxID=1314786 RepID=A0A6J3LSY9_9PEZI|nr:uncharacterized protein K489DRAFT_413701 [Dissoconium aciculare CBS 342.82]KAF1818404.1 hypothetical protein K489DRAFT_413701 [Dissoconium aciculare CBS 342.82]
MGAAKFIAISPLQDCRIFDDAHHSEHEPIKINVSSLVNVKVCQANWEVDTELYGIYEVSDVEQLSAQVEQAWLGEPLALPESAILESLQDFRCKIYHLLTECGDAKCHASVMLAVTVKVAEQDAEQLQIWYEEEHLGLMAKVPGWLRSRRFERVLPAASATEMRSEVEFLALYDFEQNHGLQGIAHKAASATARTAAIREILRSKDNMVLRHVADLKPSTPS